MKAKITSWEVKEIGPAFDTRQEHYDSDGKLVAATYDGVSEVTMKFQVIGNVDAAQEFLWGVRVGQPIKSINLGEIKPRGRRLKAKARMYVFDE